MKIERKTVLRVLLIVLAVAAALAVSWKWISEPLVGFVKNPEAFQAWVSDKGVWGMAAYVGMCMLQVIIAIIPGEPFEIAGGYAFGWLGGTLLAILGATVGSAATFSFVKRFGKRAANFLSSREKVQKLAFLQDEKKLHLITFILFFLPGTPKDLLTYCAALTPMRLGEFLLISALARVPSVITSTIGGHALVRREYLFAVIVFAVTFLVSGLGLWLYNRYTARRAKNTPRRPLRPHRPTTHRVYRKTKG